MPREQKRSGFARRAARLDERRITRCRTLLARRVSSRRLELGLSQEEAATRAEIDVRGWQRVEAGKTRNPTLLTLLGISRALRMKLSTLLEGS
jgi:transcriptional regulator with XRE-family HTH domain